MEDQPKLSIIILNWNTADLLVACLTSIEKHVTLDRELFVVDNASVDDSVERTRERFPGVTLLPQSENLGFSRGNNLALERARGEYLLLLNPDTEIRPGALEALVHFLDESPRAGIAGPTLRFPDGRHQRSTTPFPTIGAEFLRQTMLWHVIPNRDRADAARDDTRRVDAVTGAALCIRRECYRAIGPLDPDLFMFYEDTDWCRRALDAGWETWYVTCPGVIHVKAAASGAHARARTLLDSQRSTIRYFRKHCGERSVGRLRGVALAGSILRLLRAGLLWCAGVNRRDQAERARAYGRILRWSLVGGEL